MSVRSWGLATIHIYIRVYGEKRPATTTQGAWEGFDCLWASTTRTQGAEC